MVDMSNHTKTINTNTNDDNDGNGIYMYIYIYTLFFKTMGHLLAWVPPRLILSCLVFPGLALSGFLVILNLL